MRIVIVGASGNVGFALARRLAPEPGVELVGVARRVPRAGAVPIAEGRGGGPPPGAPGEGVRGGAAAPPPPRGGPPSPPPAPPPPPHNNRRRAGETPPPPAPAPPTRTNTPGSERFSPAGARAGVPVLVSPPPAGASPRGPKAPGVDERGPVAETPSSFSPRHKVEVERLLDRF